MGSIFKSFTIASALNENKVKKESEFDVREPLKLKGKTSEYFSNWIRSERTLNSLGVREIKRCKTNFLYTWKRGYQ